MKPIDFKQSTKVLQKPSTMSDAECQSLPVWCDGTQCVSCWKPTVKERLKILFGGKVWLGVLSGKTQPPVFVSGESVFCKTPIKAQIKAFFCNVKEWVNKWMKRLSEAAKQPDKWKHFIVGFLFSLIFGLVVTPWFGLTFSIIAGAVKEWWDSEGHGSAELMDFFFTVSGALSAIMFLSLITILF